MKLESKETNRRSLCRKEVGCGGKKKIFKFDYSMRSRNDSV